MLRMDEFNLGIDMSLAVPSSRAYRPPSWPPPRNWGCIEDKEGNVVSRWGDPIWHLWPWCDTHKVLNFGDGPALNGRSPKIDSANADLLRLLVTWRGWGPCAARTVSTLDNNFFKPMRKIVALCSRHGVLASELSRFPALLDEIVQEIAPSQFGTVITELDRIVGARELLGFVLLDQAGIQRLKAAQRDRSSRQTPYIPPRIWEYQVGRLKACLDDYVEHQPMVEECFAFCRDAYERNGVPQAMALGRKTSNLRPFQDRPDLTGVRSGLVMLGTFADTAQRFGIKSVMEKWTGVVDDKRGIQGFTAYLSLVMEACLLYVLNFTLMRADEVMTLRSNCLDWEDDEVFGRIPLIRGETTKTDPDSNGIWITSPSIETAIQVMRSVSKLRLSCVGESFDENSYLVTHNYEYWAKPKKAELKLRPQVLGYGNILAIYPLLLDPQALVITQDDLRIARSVEPSLDPAKFQVGMPWRLTKHQLRRTGAVNMVASPTVSDSSVQLQLKHLTRLMSLYYGRGNTALHLNESARIELVNAQYEAMGRELAAIHSSRFISPHGDEHKKALLSTGIATNPSTVTLISEKDAIRYEMAARRGEITFRRTTLGVCMNKGQCDGDCIESVGDCAGGNGKAACAHVLFDPERARINQIRLNGVMAQLTTTTPDTPKFRALAQEKLGLENYFAFINRD